MSTVDGKTLSLFRQILSQAAYNANPSDRRMVGQFFIDNQAFQDDVDLASKAIEYFCCEASQFTNRLWPIRAAVLFLQEISGKTLNKNELEMLKNCLWDAFSAGCSVCVIRDCLESYFPV